MLFVYMKKCQLVTEDLDHRMKFKKAKKNVKRFKFDEIWGEL